MPPTVLAIPAIFDEHLALPDQISALIIIIVIVIKFFNRNCQHLISQILSIVFLLSHVSHAHVENTANK